MALLAAGTVGAFLIPSAGSPQAEPTATGAPVSAQAPPSAPVSGPAPASSDVAASPGPSDSAGPVLPSRPADQLQAWANQISIAVSVPVVAVQAYGYAQVVMDRSDPTCHLTWTTLAAIGQSESTHGQAGGAKLGDGGRSVPPIVGPLLDGRGGRAEVKDTDAGAFDGDSRFDRAMGPLKLMPAVWRAQAIDADSDGILDPYDIDDSALALARLLCSGTDDLALGTGWNAALARYRSGTSYARNVFGIADDYGRRTRNIG
jgi:membrane-bound lytic murein transglycosylase B